MSFDYLPQPNILCSLYPRALNSLNELAKAIRMWVILNTIYGEATNSLKLILNNSFTYAEWRGRFFKQAEIHQQEKSVSLHDENCFCAKTIHDWLFNSDNYVDKAKWQETLKQINFGDKFHEKRPFSCTRRSIQNSFTELVSRQWLGKKGDRYSKLEQLPQLDRIGDQEHNVKTLKFLREDIAEITGNYFEPINNVSRFFIHVEYVPSGNAIDNVGDYQDRLKNIWSKTPVNPIEIFYKSASFHHEEALNYVVYPVCIYYYRRAPYLCAYGQTPQNSNVLQWYNYRLDRITQLKELTWKDTVVPAELKNQWKRQHHKFDPEYIQEQLEEAFGFDFYLDSDTMLLRFEQEFCDRYIKNTQRHHTFTHLSSPQAIQNFLKQNCASSAEKSTIRHKLAQYPQDAYYTMKYRQGDNNVIWRLRTWGSKVEVLFPTDLRNTIIQDIQAANKIYQ